MVMMAKTMMFAVLSCHGCEPSPSCFGFGCGPAPAPAPAPRRLLRGRSHLQPLCRRILPITTTIMMIMLMSSHWQILKHRAMERAVLLVVVPGGRPTLLRLCSDPARRDGAVAA